VEYSSKSGLHYYILAHIRLTVHAECNNETNQKLAAQMDLLFATTRIFHTKFHKYILTRGFLAPIGNTRLNNGDFFTLLRSRVWKNLRFLAKTCSQFFHRNLQVLPADTGICRSTGFCYLALQIMKNLHQTSC
jgi:hypothetical protein